MKNILKFNVVITIIAVVLISLTACNDSGNSGSFILVGSTSGSLTINNIPAEYNGKWAYASAMDLENGLILVAAANVNSSGTTTFEKISNSSVTLKVWENNTRSSLINYNGNDTLEFMFLIFNKSFLPRDYDLTYYDDISEGDGWALVTFVNGVGTGVYVQYSWELYEDE